MFLPTKLDILGYIIKNILNKGRGKTVLPPLSMMQHDTGVINSQTPRSRGGEKPPKSCFDLAVQTLGLSSSCAAGANSQLFPRP